MDKLNEEKNINNIILSAQDKILVFKESNNELYKLILNFCSANDVIIYNKNFNLSYKLNDLDNDFNFSLLSIYPKKHTLMLCDNIFSKISKYVKYMAFLYDRKFIILIDNIKLIEINLLFLSSEQVLTNILFPSIKIYGIEVKYMNDILTVLKLSKELYKPDNLLGMLNKDNKKYDEFKKILSSNKNIITSKKIINKNIIRLFEHIKQLFKNKYKDDYIVLLSKPGEISINTNSIHIITDNNGLNRLLECANSFDSKYEIEKKRSNIYIDDDFRLYRYTISFSSDNRKHNYIYVYTSLAYDIIPVIDDIEENILIAHPLVVVRYILYNYIYLMLFTINPSFNYNDIPSFKNTSYKYIKYIGTYINEKIDIGKSPINVVRIQKIKN